MSAGLRTGKLVGGLSNPGDEAAMSDEGALAYQIPREEYEVLAMIGATLLLTQSVEEALRVITTFVIQKGNGLDLKTLEAQTKAEQKKTIGYFIGELRKRADLREDLEGCLTSFLSHRNTLAHNIEKVPGWNLKTEEGREAARVFLAVLMHESSLLTTVFGALGNAWMKAAIPGAEVPNQAMIDAMTATYTPHLNDLFRAKK